MSRSTVNRVLARLIARGYIEKHEYSKNNHKRASYKYCKAKLDNLGISADSTETEDGMYYTVEQWMVSKYHLSSTALIVFALIHSFTVNNDGFRGTINYISRRTGLCRRACQYALKSLFAPGYLTGGYDRHAHINHLKTVELCDRSEVRAENTDNKTNNAAGVHDKPRISVTSEGLFLYDEDSDIPGPKPQPTYGMKIIDKYNNSLVKTLTKVFVRLFESCGNAFNATISGISPDTYEFMLRIPIKKSILNDILSVST